MSAERTTVTIGLPLPLDVAATLSNLIGLAYPGAMIDTTVGHGQMCIVIPAEQREANKVTKKAAAAAIVHHDDDLGDARMLGFTSEPNGDGTSTAGVSVMPPEELALTFAHGLRAALGEHPEAENYLEWTVHDRQDPTVTYLVYACRSAGQTPHELRRSAEAERDWALARVAELESGR